MERLTEKFKDGRNILRKGITDIFHVGFGRFFEGEAVDKFAEYEDLEEQGRLLELPCKSGDIVYDVVLCNDGKYHVFEMKVCNISPFGDARGAKAWNAYLEGRYVKAYRSFYDFGKTVFLTRQEAEDKLAEMEGKNNV